MRLPLVSHRFEGEPLATLPRGDVAYHSSARRAIVIRVCASCASMRVPKEYEGCGFIIGAIVIRVGASCASMLVPKEYEGCRFIIVGWKVGMEMVVRVQRFLALLI